MRGSVAALHSPMDPLAQKKVHRPSTDAPDNNNASPKTTALLAASGEKKKNENIVYTNTLKTLTRPTAIPKDDLAVSVRIMTEGIQHNASNHFKEGELGWKKCNHVRVETWKYDQCADCKKNLGLTRLKMEEARANAVIAEDSHSSPTELADRCHQRGVTAAWLLAFTFDHDCCKSFIHVFLIVFINIVCWPLAVGL